MVIQDVFTLFVTDKMSECRDFYARFFGFRVDVDSPIYLQMSTAGAGESRFSLAFMPTGHTSASEAHAVAAGAPDTEPPSTTPTTAPSAQGRR